MKSIVLITSARSSGDIRMALAKWAGVLAIALLTTAGCSVNVSRPYEESPWATSQSEREHRILRTDSYGYPTPLRQSVVVAEVPETQRDAEALVDERLIEAQIVGRFGCLTAHYGALLRLPAETMFWRGAAQCDNNR